MIHIAVLLRPYLNLILDGSKTVEARLTRDYRPPFNAISPGDRIYFKQSAGPYRATAIVQRTLFQHDLTPTAVRRLRTNFNSLILGSDDYWQSKCTARYATLIWFRDLRTTCAGPAIPPLQGRAWLTLPYEPARRRFDPDDPNREPNRDNNRAFTIPLSSANLRNGTVSLAGHLHRFPPRCIGGPTRAAAAQPLTLVLHEGPVIRTDIVRDKSIFRSRSWPAWFNRHLVHAGDRLLLEFVGPDEIHVGLVHRPRRPSHAAAENNSLSPANCP
jgi:ASC-1-like (ASCH) protein